MLPHAIYFETLAGTADETSPGWHETVAGLVVLRLVDDWLDFGPHVVSTDVTGLAAVRRSIEQVSEGNPVRALLGQIVDGMEGGENVSIQTVAPQLFAYAQALQYSAQPTLEKDVLCTLKNYAEVVHDVEILVRTSIRLGILFRNAGQLAEAEEMHSAAIQHAQLIGDSTNACLARLGLAKTTAARGNLPLADSICVSVVHEAEQTENSRILGVAWHDRSYIANFRHDYQNAIRFAYQALEYTLQPVEHDRIMLDIGFAFFNLGHFSAARDTHLLIAACAQEQEVRWSATINLMYAAAKEWQQGAFELYLATLALPTLPPPIAMHYHWIAGEGFRIFGHLEQAEEAFRKAHAIAERHGMQQFVFELEHELAKQPVGNWSEDIDSIADAIGEKLRLQIHSGA